MCKLEGASFWEKTPGADYLPHHLTLPEGTVYIINLTEKYNRDYTVMYIFSLKVGFHWLMHVSIIILRQVTGMQM